MEPSIMQERHELILSWLKEARHLILDGISNQLQVETKTRPSDLVTNIDRSVEKYLVEQIKEHFPDDQIMAEEGFGDQSIDLTQGTVWFVDPIDGTLNFVMQGENFCVMIGVYDQGVGRQGYVYDVMQDKLYHATDAPGVYCNGEKLPTPTDRPLSESLYASSSIFYTGRNHIYDLNREVARAVLAVRTIGSAGLEAVELAKGSIGLYLAYALKPWDIGASQIIVEASGGIVTDLKGKSIDLTVGGPTLMALPTAGAEVLSMLEEANQLNKGR